MVDETRAALLRTRLTAAEAAMDELMAPGNGQAVRVVQRGDRRVEYTTRNLGDLSAYIVYLRQELSVAEGTNGAIRPYW